EISQILAISTQSKYFTKYQRENIKNTSKFETQKIFSSPFSTVILASNFKTPFHGKKCLRNRISNISELVINQSLIAKQYHDTIKRLTQELQLQQNFQGQAIKKYLWNRMNKDQFFALNKIFAFQKAIQNEQWLKWYIEIGSNYPQDFTKLVTVMDEFKTTNENIGQNAKNTIKGFTEYITKAVTPIKEMASLFPSTTS
ncbi:MAG: hypothetical protein OEQ12_03680, partial [Nitrosopumilus sp.]|nr:hypothetical protein [Nitrosopumilus sp.]